LISNCSRRDELLSRKGFGEFFLGWLDGKKREETIG
jgi:hypothetical protein